MTVGALVLFQIYSARDDQAPDKPDTRERSRRGMFERDEEQHAIKPEETTRGRPEADREAPGS